ncbi:hypothetical protein F4809DRAFT_97784 [Biscogniauxia mediterranea]|nr:hypothetical protein F4809DRAFT_97784 [Biscogniauxia mediterranea]
MAPLLIIWEIASFLQSGSLFIVDKLCTGRGVRVAAIDHRMPKPAIPIKVNSPYKQRPDRLWQPRLTLPRTLAL